MLTTLKLGKTEYPFALDVEAYRDFKKLTGITMMEGLRRLQAIQKKDGSIDTGAIDFDVLVPLAYVGLDSGAYHTGQDFNLKVRDVGRKMKVKDLVGLLIAFTEALEDDGETEEEEEESEQEPSKKKPVTTATQSLKE